MGPRIWGRASVSYAFGLSLAFLGLAAGLLLFVIAALWDYSTFSVDWVVYGIYLDCAAFVASGLLLWWFRPSNLLGPLIVGNGFLWLDLGLEAVPDRTVSGLATVFGSAVIAGLVMMLLAFPSGRLQSGWARLVVAGTWFASLILWAPQWLYDPAQPWSIGDDPQIVARWENVDFWGFAVPLCVVMIAILLARIRWVEPGRRWVLWPLYGYGVMVIFALPIIHHVLGPHLHLSEAAVSGLQIYTIIPVPIFFAAAALSGVFGRTGQVDELAAWLARTRGSERDVEHVLTETLGDPSLMLLFWLEGSDRYVDADGVVVDLPRDSAGRGVVSIDVGDRHVGAIVYDSELIADPAPVRAAAQVVAISVDRERLLADLRASEEALRRSRTRIVEAGDVERRRFAQSLHDSVQGQLVLLAIQARALADDPTAPEAVRAEALALWAGIDATASDLRQQVHTVMPALLLERGLVAAIEEVVDRMPVHTDLTVGDLSDHLPTAVQTTAYFIVAEALTNAAKHARASRISVVLDEADAGLVVTVEDDGVGAAGTPGGSGLRGLGDRADALGGRLTFDSVAGRGSRLTAVLPSQPVGSRA